MKTEFYIKNSLFFPLKYNILLEAPNDQCLVNTVKSTRHRSQSSSVHLPFIFFSVVPNSTQSVIFHTLYSQLSDECLGNTWFILHFQSAAVSFVSYPKLPFLPCNLKMNALQWWLKWWTLFVCTNRYALHAIYTHLFHSTTSKAWKIV